MRQGVTLTLIQQPGMHIGSHLWPVSMALCKYFELTPELVANKKVIELGAGIGLLGLVIARLGAAHVCLTGTAHFWIQRHRVERLLF